VTGEVGWAGGAGSSPVGVRASAVPPAAEPSDRASTSSPVAAAVLVVRTWVPAASVIPWAEGPQPRMVRPQLARAVAVEPEISMSTGRPSTATRSWWQAVGTVDGVVMGATPGMPTSARATGSVLALFDR
jgi:hypothetical protein